MNARLRLEKIRKGRLWRFFGGIRPPGGKNAADVPISDAGLPAIITLPLDRHLGPGGKILVKAGDYVKRGQPLTVPAGDRLVPLHATTSGTVAAIAPEVLPHPSGYSGTCVTIRPDGQDVPFPSAPLPDFEARGSDELLSRVRASGIEGLGGALFQTAAKLRSGRDDCPGGCQLFIVNGCECEPAVSCDDRLMREKAAEIVLGIRIIQRILRPALTVIAIEADKAEAVREMRRAAEGTAEVRVLRVVYPSGAARNLIKIITGVEIPYAVHASDCGIVVDNVGTVLAVKEAVIDGVPLISRVVTLSGGRLREPLNVRVRLGTSVRYLLNLAGLSPERHQRIILGGPMMGFTLKNIDVPVTKSVGCILAPGRDEIPLPPEELNCLRCGRCARVCPSRLVPYQMYQQSVAGNHAAAQKCGISDCTECGCCSYVCPSRIHLTGQFRYEKKAEKHLAELEHRNLRARERMAIHDANEEKFRLEREARKAEALARIRAGGQDPGAPAREQAIARARQAALQRRRRAGVSDADRSPDLSAVTRLAPKTVNLREPAADPARNQDLPESLRRGGGRRPIKIMRPLNPPQKLDLKDANYGSFAAPEEDGARPRRARDPDAVPEPLKRKSLKARH